MLLHQTARVASRIVRGQSRVDIVVSCAYQELIAVMSPTAQALKCIQKLRVFAFYFIYLPFDLIHPLPQHVKAGLCNPLQQAKPRRTLLSRL
jgi:hypothetical protein